MPPQLALAGYFLLVGVLLLIDLRRKPRSSAALWVPTVWVAILASRPVAAWMSTGWMDASGSATVEDGSPLDRAVLSALIVVALVIVVRRKVSWKTWLWENRWILLFFVYCGFSILWSDFPGIAFKRWIRAVGSVLMIAAVLSEVDPQAAAQTLMRRCAYTLVPLSIILIRYYRAIAVTYNPWTGAQALSGATTDKNALGRLCLLAALFAVWDIVKRGEPRTSKGTERFTKLFSFAIVAMSVWLLRESDSATSLLSLIVGSAVLLISRLYLSRSRVSLVAWGLGVGACLAAVAMASPYSFMEAIVSSVGRNMTFTERTFVWQALLDMHTNPFVGVGYDSLWLGKRLDWFLKTLQVNEAHNGYLEVYVELGVVGIALFIGLVFSAFGKATKALSLGSDYGRLRLAVLVVCLLYNVTEAAYKATTFMFFVFLLTAIEAPRKVEEAVEEMAPLAGVRPAMIGPIDRKSRTAASTPPAGIAPSSRLRRYRPVRIGN